MDQSNPQRLSIRFRFSGENANRLVNQRLIHFLGQHVAQRMHGIKLGGELTSDIPSLLCCSVDLLQRNRNKIPKDVESLALLGRSNQIEPFAKVSSCAASFIKTVWSFFLSLTVSTLGK